MTNLINKNPPKTSTPILFVLVILVSICLLGSKIPYLGIVFGLPLHDLILLMIGSLIVHIIRIRMMWAMIFIILIWGFLSLIIEISRVDLYLFGVKGVLSPNSTMSAKLISENKTVSLHGDVNDILYANGQPAFFGMNFNVAGMKSLTGVSRFNRASSVSIVETVFRRGWYPRIGDSSYPRITVRRKYKNSMEVLSIVVEQAEGVQVAFFERAYPLPPVHPGSLVSIWGPVLQIFNDNLIRWLFELNREIGLRQELKTFMNSVLNTEKEESENLPYLDMIVMDSQRIEVAFERQKDGIEKNIIDLNSVKQERPSVNIFTRCPFVPHGMEYGSDAEGRTYVSVAGFKGADWPPKRPVVLGGINPYHREFTFLCDAKRRELISFVQYGNQLKIIHFDDGGKMKFITYARMPIRLEHPTQVVEESVIFQNGQISEFAFAMPLVVSQTPNRVLEKDKYLRVRLAVQRR